MNNNCNSEFRQRITLNIRGCKFETYEETLLNYPETLLGCPEKRRKFYNPKTKEYYLDTDKCAFDAILFYYQSQGILSRPETVPMKTFDEELSFYQLKPEKGSKKLWDDVTPNQPWRRKAWELLELPESSQAAAIYAGFSFAIIVMSVATFCFETIYIRKNFRNLKSGGNSNEDLGNVYNREEFWFVIDTCLVTWFTGEYFFRLLLSPQKCKFVISALGIIDLIAIIPYFITVFIRFSFYNQAASFTFLCLFRSLRALRLLKLTRYVPAMRILGLTLRSCKDQLTSFLFMIFTTALAFSGAMYYAEHVENREEFDSIIAAVWYTLVTMTTVGYGDMKPITPLGRLVGSFCAVFGVAVVLCLPTPVFVLHFNELYCRYRGKPHAGKSAKNSFSVVKKSA